MDSFVFSSDCVVNSHKHELLSRGCYQRAISYVSPGCLCEPHIVTTVKQIDFMDGRQIKETYPSSYQKYRTRKHMLNYWEQGAVIIEAKEGSVTIHPIRIKKDKNEYVTSFNDKIFLENEIIEP
jgi:hypothetical protein